MISEGKSSRGCKTTWAQRAAMVGFLEIPSNFNLITGNGTANHSFVIAGVKVTKESGYADLKDEVNAKCGTKWTTDMAKSRFRAYLKQYKDTKRNLLNDGGKKYGLGEADFKKGITTIAAKLEDECPLFERMDKLFGGRQNINPSSVFQPPMPGDLDEGDSEDEDLATMEEMIRLNNTSSTNDDDDVLPLVPSVDALPPAAVESAAPGALPLAPVVSRATPAASMSDINAAASHALVLLKERGKKKDRTLPPSDLTNEESKMLSEKLLAKKPKKDFTSSYSELKTKEMLMANELKVQELELAKDRFLWDKENYAGEFRLKEQSLFDQNWQKEAELKEGTKRALLLNLMGQGKSAVEIKDMLTTLGY